MFFLLPRLFPPSRLILISFASIHFLTGKLGAVFCNDRHHNSGYGRLPISHCHSHDPKLPGHEDSLVPGLHKQWSR